MADIDLRVLPANEVVLHFGGPPNEIDAFTFSNSLLALSEAIREINRQLNPDRGIEITIDGLGGGCFRAKVKTRAGIIKGLLGDVKTVALGVLAAFLFERYVSDTRPTIIVNDESYIVETGRDRIVLPRDIAEAARGLPRPDLVQQHIAKVFSVLEEDHNVTDFGVAGRLSDPFPVGIIPRSDFGRLSAPPAAPEGAEGSRYIDERAKIIVLKAILERSARRWQFAWNSVRISAPIKDPEFYDKFEAGTYKFGYGDVLDVTLRIFQTREHGVFVNERYEIAKVHDLQRAPAQRQLFQ